MHRITIELDTDNYEIAYDLYLVVQATLDMMAVNSIAYVEGEQDAEPNHYAGTIPVTVTTAAPRIADVNRARRVAEARRRNYIATAPARIAAESAYTAVRRAYFAADAIGN